MRYIATSGTFTGEMTFGYNEAGFLNFVSIAAELSEKQWVWLKGSFPITERDLKWLADASKMLLTQVPEDLSFGVFWEAYSYKVGDKKGTERLWNAMAEPERVAALVAVKKYLRWLSMRTNMEQTHAKTWLNQRRWENDYSR